SLVADVRPSVGGGAVSGKVVFFDNGTRLDDDSVVNGSAGIVTTFTHSGIHTITAEYLGADNFLASIDQVQITVLGLPTTTTITAPVSAGPGTPVIFRARTLAANAVPTGNITFQEGSNVLAVVPLDEHDTATFATTGLGVGIHTVTASYSGPDFQGSTSAPVTVTIGGDFTVASDISSVAVTAGQSADFTITVSPSGGFAGPVAFTCTPSAGITCAFAPATLNVNQTPVSTKLTITATSTTRTARGIGFPFASFGLLGIFLVGRRARRAQNMIAFIGALALALILAACGGYGKPKSSGMPNSTPAASNVTLTVIGGSISHTSNLSVVVR
ncbi:MAG TPA: Ig-like domain-containing protein, partial [Terriglobales bacterium]|nr:Ig-like domain-containing protein [Terriglobales bacterium]